MGSHSAVEKISVAFHGSESDEELRARIIQLTLSSVWHPSNNRIIRMLAGLSFSSLINLVSGMTRDVCLEILASENIPTGGVLPSTVGRDLPPELQSPVSPRFPAPPIV
jgi:hypothetical protein